MPVEPPRQDEWWDTASTVGRAMHRLQLRPGDRDEAKIVEFVDVGGEMINDYIDAHPDSERPVTALMRRTLVDLVVVLARSNDVALSTAAGLNSVTPEMLEPGTELGDVLSRLRSKRQRWGLA